MFVDGRGGVSLGHTHHHTHQSKQGWLLETGWYNNVYVVKNRFAVVSDVTMINNNYTVIHCDTCDQEDIL